MVHDKQSPPEFPSAWLDLDALDHNIKRVNCFTSGKSLRLATKSIRSIPVLRYIRERSPHYIGLMSYSAKETVYLLKAGFNDILCAYPTFDRDAVAKTIPFLKNNVRVIWMIDKLEHWHFLNDIGKEYQAVLNVCIDINLSMSLPTLYFGTKRSSIVTLDDLKALLKGGASYQYTKIEGLMGYEGQIAGLPENVPGKEIVSPIIRILKYGSKRQLEKRRQEMVTFMTQEGYPIQLVNGGGSGSMTFTCSQPEVTEITVGSAYYFPALFSHMDTMDAFLPAAGFVLQVTRKPEPRVVTCHSGGFIASGSIGPEKTPQIIYPKNLAILPNEGYGEVQTPLQILSDDTTLELMDPVWCRHSKAGELCEHFDKLYLYRGRKLCPQPVLEVTNIENKFNSDGEEASKRVADKQDAPSPKTPNSYTHYWFTYRGEGQCFH